MGCGKCTCNKHTVAIIILVIVLLVFIGIAIYYAWKYYSYDCDCSAQVATPITPSTTTDTLAVRTTDVLKRNITDTLLLLLQNKDPGTITTSLTQLNQKLAVYPSKNMDPITLQSLNQLYVTLYQYNNTYNTTPIFKTQYQTFVQYMDKNQLYTIDSIKTKKEDIKKWVHDVIPLIVNNQYNESIVLLDKIYNMLFLYREHDTCMDKKIIFIIAKMENNDRMYHTKKYKSYIDFFKKYVSDDIVYIDGYDYTISSKDEGKLLVYHGTQLMNPIQLTLNKQTSNGLYMIYHKIPSNKPIILRSNITSIKSNPPKSLHSISYNEMFTIHKQDNELTLV